MFYGPIYLFPSVVVCCPAFGAGPAAISSLFPWTSVHGDIAGLHQSAHGGGGGGGGLIHRI